MMEKQPIGVFDSGIGGLSILKQIQTLLPMEDLLYFADQQHVPYGSRSLDEVRKLSEGIVRFLRSQGAKVIVLACNTASAASLHFLRAVFPAIPFVGMEPAVKPAAEQTKTGVVGVLATPATFQGELFASVVDRYADGIEVLQSTLPGLVEQIEAGNLSGVEVERILNAGIVPLIERSADVLVLGCTHFPFVLPIIRSLSGDEISVIDPSPAIANRTAQLLEEHSLSAADDRPGIIRFVTSGNLKLFSETIARLKMPAGQIQRARWINGSLTLEV